MAERLRILLLIPSMAGAAGTERMVHSLSELLAQSGHDVHQASFDAPATRRHFRSNVPFHPLGPLPQWLLPLRPLIYAVSAFRLRRLKSSLGINVTISNLWRADLVSALSGGTDRKVALCHINVVGNPSNRLMMRLRPVVATVYRRLDRVIAVNEALAEELRGLYRLTPERSGFVENFVQPLPTRSALPADDMARFIWCGRFSPEKNVDGLLHAWARFARTRPAAQLVLVGDGPQRAEMRALAGSLGLCWGEDLHDTHAQVVATGQVPSPAAYMLGARALLLSSRAEGLPMVLLEALSLGVPVLAADCPAGGVRAALANRGRYDPDLPAPEPTAAGLLLPVPRAEVPGTLEVWADALAVACEHADLRARWEAGALDRARLFSRDTAQEKWAEVLTFGTRGA